MIVDWRAFSVDAQARYERPVDMARDLGLSQSTVMAAWHGRPVGLLPFLNACQAMGAHPLRYLVHATTPRHPGADEGEK